MAALTPIKLARLQKGILQWQLAGRIGVAESYLSRIETGRATPAPALLEKIARALEVPAETLRGNDQSDKRRDG